MHVLSFPTWVIHISSVVEWIAAIFLVGSFANQAGRYPWRWLAWGMLPALFSAMCALTWHGFDNQPNLEWLVTLQAALTLVGNCTLALAAYVIWRQEQQVSPSTPETQIHE